MVKVTMIHKSQATLPLKIPIHRIYARPLSENRNKSLLFCLVGTVQSGPGDWLS